MIDVQNVRKVFHSGRENEFTALRGVCLQIPTGQVTVLRGPSGSGKTTLLSLVGCMARPTSGRIAVQGREVTSLPEKFLTEIRRKTFGFVFQQFHLLRGISALENVMLPAYPLGIEGRVLRGRALALLERFGMAGKAGTRVEWLSGGEAQRVAIARALINEPEIIIADEPTAHLDTKLSHEFMKIVEALHSEGKTVIIASHDPIVCEASSMHHVVSMRDGALQEPLSA